MDTAILDNFEHFIDILKVGGGYAGWALFFWMWLRADRRYVKAMSDLKEIAMTKLENDVKTEQTLAANAKGLEGIGHKLDDFGNKYVAIKTTLEKILLLKNRKIQVED